MNFGDLVEELWKFTGHPDTGSDRPDYLRQSFRDEINKTISEICAISAPQTFALVREATLALVAGTDTYYADDWCQRILSMYFTDPSSGYTYSLRFRRPRNVDMDGSRSPNLVQGQLGRFQVTLAPRTNAAVLSGINGSTTGASATEGAFTITTGSGTPVASSSYVGNMIKLNGDYGDYKILSASNTREYTVDRPIRSRISGVTVAVNGYGAGYTNVKWEISPPGRYRVQFLPKPTIAQTVNYRYMALPRKLLSNDDVPEILEEYHHLIYKGACLKVAAAKENAGLYGIYQTEFNDAMAQMRKSDIDDVDSTDAPQYEKLGANRMQYDLPPGTLYHGDGGYGGYGYY